MHSDIFGKYLAALLVYFLFLIISVVTSGRPTIFCHSQNLRNKMVLPKVWRQYKPPRRVRLGSICEWFDVPIYNNNFKHCKINNIWPSGMI